MRIAAAAPMRKPDPIRTKLDLKRLPALVFLRGVERLFFFAVLAFAPELDFAFDRVFDFEALVWLFLVLVLGLLLEVPDLPFGGFGIIYRFQQL